MAKRKPARPSVNINLVRWVAIGFVVLVSVFLAFHAMSSFLQHAQIFLIKDIAISSELGDVDVVELNKLKGKNIFLTDLARTEDRMRTKYPQFGGLKILKHFPDQINIVGYYRTPVVLVSSATSVLAVSRDGFFCGHPSQDQLKTLPRVKGLRVAKMSPGVLVGDPRLEKVFEINDIVLRYAGLTALGLGSIDLSDEGRVVCSFGEAKAAFDVYMDQSQVSGQLQQLSTMVAQPDLDIMKIKYIDLRFGAPVIGWKKAVK